MTVLARLPKLAIALTVAALLLAAIAFTISVQTSSGFIQGSASPAMSPDETEIRELLQNFAAATQREDHAAVASMLCSDEAQEYLDYVMPDPDDEVPIKDAETQPVDIRLVTVQGQVAVADLTSNPEVGEVQIHLRQEAGRWTVCSSAATDLPN